MMKGPSEVIKKVCYGCDYHDNELVHSGKTPLYAHYCTNPDVQADYVIKKEKEFIGDSADTPSWCPYLTSNI